MIGKGLDMAHLQQVLHTAMTKWGPKMSRVRQPRKKAQATFLAAATDQDSVEYHRRGPSAPLKGSRMGSWVLVILGLVLLSSTVYAEERIALLVGNQAYAKEVGPLENPINDISQVGAALKKIGFKVERLSNAGFGDLHKAVNRYVRRLRQAGDDAIGFFYYSGHGGANPDTNVNYLIPVDVQSADEEQLWDNSIRLQRIIDDLE